MGPEFFQTRMGQRFYEVTMPKIADELARLNQNIEALVAAINIFPPGSALSASLTDGISDDNRRQP